MAQLSANRFALLAMVIVALAAAGSGCASGSSDDTGVNPIDTNGRDAPANDTPAFVPDTPLTDAPRDTPPVVDGGPGCGGGPVCMGLTRCVDGSCVDYPPCRGDNTCPDPADVCLARRCIPGTDDPDRDGSPASEDCDETNPLRNPRLPELCNLLDDNCNGAPDDGDPAQLCANGDQPGVCMAGVCSCPPGTFDLDRAVLGCECTGAPLSTEGVACTSPIDLGAFPDTGSTMTVTGNALPTGREVWYTLNAVDTPDTTCDNFHFRVQFTPTGNPGGVYEFVVLRGGCDPSVASAMTDYSYSTDFAPSAVPGGNGECPCSPANDSASVAGHFAAPGLNYCSDNSARYNVRVRRITGSVDACDAFSLEITNGVYDSAGDPGSTCP